MVYHKLNMYGTAGVSMTSQNIHADSKNRYEPTLSCYLLFFAKLMGDLMRRS